MAMDFDPIEKPDAVAVEFTRSEPPRRQRVSLVKKVVVWEAPVGIQSGRKDLPLGHHMLYFKYKSVLSRATQIRPFKSSWVWLFLEDYKFYASFPVPSLESKVIFLHVGAPQLA